MSDPIESAITAEHSRQEYALAVALDQIDVAFGKSENLTPEQRIRRTQYRLDKLLAVREGVAALAAGDAAKDRDDQGWSPIDPVTAFVVGWYLRKEADSDHVISMDHKASEVLEEAASHIESGEILADPEQMLREIDDEIDALREEIDGLERSA